MEILELYHIKTNKIVPDFSETLYQYKVGLFLFPAIAIKPDIAFAVFRLPG